MARHNKLLARQRLDIGAPVFSPNIICITYIHHFLSRHIHFLVRVLLYVYGTLQPKHRFPPFFPLELDPFLCFVAGQRRGKQGIKGGIGPACVLSAFVSFRLSCRLYDTAAGKGKCVQLSFVCLHIAFVAHAVSID